MSRKNLNSLSSSDKQELFNLLLEYIKESGNDPVTEHANHHNNHGENFLNWHRGFISRLENWLNTIKGKNKFVPIPFWNPAYAIPDEFAYLEAERISENINDPLPKKFTVFGDGSKSLIDYKNYAELNNEIREYHNGLHGAIGGLMADPKTTAGDPIFWVLHAMFDLVWEQWQDIQNT